jgi:hypothetical protein
MIMSQLSVRVQSSFQFSQVDKYDQPRATERGSSPESAAQELNRLYGGFLVFCDKTVKYNFVLPYTHEEK